MGNYTTSLEMAGGSVTLTLLDGELTKLGRAGAHGGAALVSGVDRTGARKPVRAVRYRRSLYVVAACAAMVS